MLPGSHRLRRPADFTAVMRGGSRKGRRTMVVHAHVVSEEIRVGGPRFGLIVSKAVGDAVTRHRVSRRLRHLAADLVDGLEPDLHVVIRANPAAASATHAELERDLRTATASATARAREVESR